MNKVEVSPETVRVVAPSLEEEMKERIKGLVRKLSETYGFDKEQAIDLLYGLKNKKETVSRTKTVMEDINTYTQPSNEIIYENPLYAGSDTAKNGYKEEGIICHELNEDKSMKESLKPITGAQYDLCKRISGNSKTDVASENGVLKAQIKKIKKKQFQQVDRGWTKNLVNDIPSLHPIEQILCNCFEYPLKEDGRYVDKSVPLKKLTLDNYTQDELELFIEVLNKNKRKIVERAFLGYKESTQPNCLIASEYDKKKRIKIVAFKMNDIIDYLVTLDFKIGPKKTSVILGDDSVFQMKRKGGDGGKKVSNHVQFMITVSKLYHNVLNCQHIL